MSDPIVGIDLGTSNTVVAHADATGQAHVLADANGFKIHPSVVSFHPTGGVVVGAAAKQRKVIDPKNTIFSVKRLIGRAYGSHEVQTAKQRMPYQIKEGQNQLPLVVTRGGEFAVPEISAIVLDHVRNIASMQLKTEVSRAVVTVPASFNDAQRSATATAGSIAGLTVARVLNEPTAAALAYGHTRNLNETIAVYDFGGGTFDITILKLADQVYEVLGTSGNTFLGGDDLDERLVDRMVDKFLAENRVDLRTNEVSMMRLRAVAEQTKIELSRRSRAVVRVDEIAYGARGKPLDLQIEIRRDEFVKQVADIIDRTFPVCEEALKYANLTIDGIDDVILVGGTTKIPYVRDQVSKFFAKAPRTDVNPEDAVAVGAALQAQALERVLNRKKSSQVPVPSSFAPEETEERTNEIGGPRHERATSYSQRGSHADRLEGKTAPPPPPPPPSQPVIGRLTKDIKPAPGTKTAPGVAQSPHASTQRLPSGQMRPAGQRKTEMGVPIVRVPAKPAPPPPPSSRESSTVIVDPSASDTGIPATSEDLDFPNYQTEKGFLDLDDATAPAPKLSPRRTQLAEDDFSDLGTEKGFLDLDDSMSPASTAKGFSPPPANTQRTMPAQRPPASPPTASPAARTLMIEPSPAAQKTMIESSPPQSRTFERSPSQSPTVERSPSQSQTFDRSPPQSPTFDRSPPQSPTMIAPPPSPPQSPTLIAQHPPSSMPPGPLQPPAWPPPPSAQPASASAPPAWPPPQSAQPAPASVPPAWPPPQSAQPAPAWPPPQQNPTLVAPQPAPAPVARPVVQSPIVMDVTPRSLGIATVAGFCEELIRRNSRVPTETRKMFSTSRDDQDAVRIIVCQGESRRLDNNVVIGDLLLQGLPRRPRGETSIEVTFHLDANGILQVRARDAQTGNEQRASLDLVGAMPQEEVSDARERLQSLRR